MDNLLNEFDFTDDEIKEQLELLGFKNLSEKKFNSFKEDLKKLIEHEKSTEESQIFNQRLDKIRKEKLFYYDENTCSDDDFNASTSSEIHFQKNDNKLMNKIMKRKIAKCNKGKSNFNPQKSNKHNYDYLEERFEKLEIKNDFKDFENDDNKSLKFTDNKFKSFIRPSTSLPLKYDGLSRVKKSNPVNKYHEYSKLWSKQKAPGENNHYNLRWSIREKLLEKHVIVKKQNNIVSNENKYEIPTDKKRQNLRWIIRNAMIYNSETNYM